MSVSNMACLLYREKAYRDFERVQAEASVGLCGEAGP